jgi:xanthine/uracil permease
MLLMAGVAYFLVGMGTAMLAGMASSSGAVKGWRLAAWLLSLGVFCVHFAIERRGDRRALAVAARVALAVAIGALLVAAFGPVRTHWGEPSRLKLAVLSLVAWPLLTGLPAFLVALIGSRVLDYMSARAEGSASRIA